MAPALPIRIVVTASTASHGAHWVWAEGSAWSRKRSRMANAATLVATAMKLVTGVGAPW